MNSTKSYIRGIKVLQVEEQVERVEITILHQPSEGKLTTLSRCLSDYQSVEDHILEKQCDGMEVRHDASRINSSVFLALEKWTDEDLHPRVVLLGMVGALNEFIGQHLERELLLESEIPRF